MLTPHRKMLILLSLVVYEGVKKDGALPSYV
jgi:hypothetical protein